MKPAQIILPEVAKLTDNPKACVAGHCHATTNTNPNARPNAPMSAPPTQHTENRVKSPDQRSISPSNIGAMRAPLSNPNITPGGKSP